MPDSCLKESIIKHFHTVSYFSQTSVRANVDVCALILNSLIFSAEFRIMARGINEDTKRSMPEHTFSRYVSLATDMGKILRAVSSDPRATLYLSLYLSKYCLYNI